MVCVDQALETFLCVSGSYCQLCRKAKKLNYLSEARFFVRLLIKMPHINVMVWNKESGREGGERRNGKLVIDLELFSSHECIAGNNVEEEILMKPEKWFYIEKNVKVPHFSKRKHFCPALRQSKTLKPVAHRKH